ncbi:CHC2 zinc finger domain-containing protein [Amorphus orientalis]|uniref:DNA primase n=1 Tax=Amorphus orientalis TaxID=649198 RepID=A0AAE3VQR8_9HYPH|nr:CHC2 zinc finger domain-containing protein [Amorphus orientalis]MDQ0316417.1 DNA primase [Amorphus orientalis]
MTKPKFIDFAAVKRAVSIEQVMEYAGLSMKKVGAGEYRGECPVHGGGKRALVVSLDVEDKKGDPGCFYCHAAGEGGDRIGLLAHVRKSGQYAAVKELAERFAPELFDGERETVPAPVPEEKEETRSGERGFKPLPYLQHEHDAVQALGFPPETAKALGIGFAPRGVHRGRIAIPLRTEAGLAGYVSIPAEGSVQLPPKWHL